MWEERNRGDVKVDRREKASMCVAFLLLGVHPKYPFLLLTNRDEYYDRPTTPVHAWEDVPGVVAGRDHVGGGTWLGVTEGGRLALVTNFRQLNPMNGVPSRGELTVNFLKSTDSPMEHLEKVKQNRHDYNGFNLLVADLKTMEVAYLSNSDHIQEPVRLKAGVYGIGNAALNCGWHKIKKGTQLLEEMLTKYGDEEIPLESFIEHILSNAEYTKDITSLPDTGFPTEWEYLQSPIFVNIDERKLDELGMNPRGESGFGTSSSTVVAWSNNQMLTFIEKYRNSTGKWHKHNHTFHVNGDYLE